MKGIRKGYGDGEGVKDLPKKYVSTAGFDEVRFSVKHRGVVHIPASSALSRRSD